ncbi:MAG: hypothetical protein ABI693_26755 [Bryobacteraceae bacterium]
MNLIVRNRPVYGIVTGCLALLSVLVTASPQAAAQDDTITTGSVVSISRNTLTVKDGNGRYQLFLLDSNTRKPAQLAVGAAVRVTSTSGDEPGVRFASLVSAVDTSSANQSAADSAVIPPEVRRIERDIERQARRLQFGVRGGIGLDPELLLIGVQAQVGPFFNRDVFFRPNVEFAFGEVTALFALNPEIIYRLPLTSRRAGWSTYVGAGPGFNFLHQNFERIDGGGKRIDFGDFHSDVGLNILGGIRYRSGMFAELKTSVYTETSPTLRLIIGYNF